MGIGGFSEKDININTGGGSMESWLPAMLMNSSKNGGDFGGNGMFGFLFLFLLLQGDCFGRNRGSNSSDSNFATDLGLSNANLLDTLKTAVTASTGIVVNAIDKSISTIVSSLDNRFAEQTANLTSQISLCNSQTTEGFVRVENGIQLLNSINQVGFNGINKTLADLSLANCHNQNQLLNSINCSTQTIKDSQSAGFSALSGQNAQLFNAITQINCNIDSKFQGLSCEISNSTRDIIQSQRDIAAAQAATDASRLIAEQAARIAKLEQCNDQHSRREFDGNNININNQIAVLSNNVNNLISVLRGASNPGNGNGNH